MKFTATALVLISSTLSLAAPTKTPLHLTTRDQPPFANFTVPGVVKVHNVVNNANTYSSQTSTIRNGSIETSTLYEIYLPSTSAGKTCQLVIHTAAGDTIFGAQAVDIFSSGITDLNTANSGNLRGQQLARMRWNAATQLYDFDTVDVVPKVQNFPCPSGGSVHYEAVAVGDLDVNVINQDFFVHGTTVPHGVSIGWF
ncbi:hypothetical protein F4804DRAFT_321074 [Jackrogersella minutella]|nr:hypothetical protein F4804DRAFT_321074 [Jackrogersella minutella]